jgi:hypothetical protein
MGKHTPGPWTHLDIGEIVAGEDHEKTLAILNDGDASVHVREVEANGALIAAAPDHALVIWAMCVAAGRWEPLGDMSGEFCINGLRYSTVLDEFGCPAVNDVLRAAILSAKGEA